MKSVEGGADSRAYSKKANNNLQPTLPQALLRFRIPLLYSARRPLDFFTLTRIFSFLIKGTEEVFRIRHKKALYASTLAVVLIASSLYLLFLLPSTQTCGEKIGSATITTSNLASTHFDGVTKFHLVGDKAPNAILAVSDASVWFGEEDVPGIAHLFSNGTLVEFAWPVTYLPSSTDIWGIAMWNGRIWASDALGNQIVGVDPSTLAVYVIRISETGAF